MLAGGTLGGSGPWPLKGLEGSLEYIRFWLKGLSGVGFKVRVLEVLDFKFGFRADGVGGSVLGNVFSKGIL